MDTDTLNSDIARGIECHKAGNLPEAEKIYRRVLSLDPNHVDANHLLGLIAHQIGNQGLAIQFITKAIDANPRFAKAHYHLGNVFKARAQWDDAKVSYEQALSIDPNMADAHNNLGLVYEHKGQMDDALSCYQQTLAIGPHTARAHRNIANVHRITGFFQDSIHSYKQALAINPHDIEAINDLGVVLLNTGSLDQAVSCFRQALAIQPDYVRAHKNLALATQHTEYDDDVAAMEALYRQDSLSSEQRMHLGFGLGKVFDDLKDYDRAFEFILSANRLKRGSYQYSTDQVRVLFGKIRKTFSTSFFSNVQGGGCLDHTPIFILGMPRSGTTLVEQILASHSIVYGAGELNDLDHFTRTLGSSNLPGQYPDCVLDLNELAFRQLGLDYIDRIRRHSTDAVHITDKMPTNFVHVGLIKAILPNAKIIHCMRNPMDTCYSIFKNDFMGAHRYAYDMIELGHYYNLYLELMAHWRYVLPGFVYDVQYEDLVSDQEHQTRKLLAFCGLPWEENCLSFYHTNRSVATASALQVRRPMYTDSIDLWKRCETQLEPLRRVILG